MSYKKVLTVQDLSCVGQCSLAAALPLLTACGAEACPLPTALLSTHTAFKGAERQDTTGLLPRFIGHWRREGLRFDAVYTGYLGGAEQAEPLRRAMDELLLPGGLRVVDPAMADHGRLYRGFDADFVTCMGELCRGADVLLPNITEACLLTGTDFVASGYGQAYADGLLRRLGSLADTVVLTGVELAPGSTGAGIRRGGVTEYVQHRRCEGSYYGTGDIFAAVLTGCLLRGLDVVEAAAVAGEFVAACIEDTRGDESHWYGVKFAQRLPWLLERLGS